MTAYACMQFASITDLERTKIINVLLKYFELETLAIVLLWEYCQNII
jgi:hypothetical protein